MENIYITIVGSGRRVCQDVVISALASGIPKSKIRIFATTNRKILVRDNLFTVNKISEIKFNTEIIYLAIPPYKVKNFIEENNKYLKDKILIIDTPMLLRSFDKAINKNTIVAEDVCPLLLKYVLPHLKIRKFNFLFFYKSFFLYHGICFTETILGKIFFMINFKIFSLIIAQKGIAIKIGSRNYEAGNIKFNFKKINFPKLTDNNLDLIGGLTGYDTFSSRFLDLKRLGLVEILQKPRIYLNNKILNHEAGFRQYRLSKKSFYIYKIFSL